MKKLLIAAAYIFCSNLIVSAQNTTSTQDEKITEVYPLGSSTFHNASLQIGFALDGKSDSKENAAVNEGFNNILNKISNDASILKSISNPKANNKPDTYKGIFWYTGANDSGVVHTNSTILHYWFYLLANGGKGTNDKGFTYDVKGIGLSKALAIAQRSFKTYAVKGEDYTDARNFSVLAAEMQYGTGSQEVYETMKAWEAVGIEEANNKHTNTTTQLVTINY